MILRDKLLSVFLSISFWHVALSQDTPYYQLPQNRDKNHEKVVMPNLDSFGINYFIATSGGLRKPFMKEINTSPSAATSEVRGTGFWEISVGQIRNDNWIWELGVAEYRAYLNTSFNELSRFPLVFRNDFKQLYVPFRAKKKVWTIDRVGRNAFVNIGIGASYLLVKQKSFSESGSFKFQQRPVPEANDYTSLDYSLRSSKFPLSFEFLTELRGKISERVEISIFAKAFLRNPAHLTNSFTFSYAGGQSSSFEVYEKPMSLIFGLQAKLNSPKYFAYKSKVQ
jgi:hypothetical protein